jgi:hypothetical protein
MVRIKHRYLLVNILYPEQDARKTKQSGSSGKDDLPYTVQFRLPGPEQLNGKLLTRLIREGVADLFGDYGSGMVSGSLVGKNFLASNHCPEIAAHTHWQSNTVPKQQARPSSVSLARITVWCGLHWLSQHLCH